MGKKQNFPFFSWNIDKISINYVVNNTQIIFKTISEDIYMYKLLVQNTIISITVIIALLTAFNTELIGQTYNSAPYCEPEGSEWGISTQPKMTAPYIKLGGLSLINDADVAIVDGSVEISNIDYNWQGYRFENQIYIGVKKNTNYIMEILGLIGPEPDEFYGMAYKVYIDYNQDNVFSPTTELALSATYDNPTYATATLNIPYSAKSGDTRMRIIVDYFAYVDDMQPCNNASGWAFRFGEARDFTLTIEKHDDAGIVEITEPLNPLELGNNEVKAELTNHGNGNLTSCYIDWSIDGVQQDQVEWTGNLGVGETEIVSLGNYDFTAKQPLGSYAIEAWTSSLKLFSPV